MRLPTRQAALGAAGLVVLAIAGVSAGTAAVSVAAMPTEVRAAAKADVDPTPSADASTSTSTAETYRTRPLRDGEKPLTADQIRTAAAGVGVDEVWITEQVITAKCMAEKGFFYDPRVTTNAPDYVGSGASLAEYGNTGGGAAYRWQDAGCWGYAVHVTGNDDNH